MISVVLTCLFMPSLQIESLSVTFHGHDLIVDSELELNYGRFVILTLQFCSSSVQDAVIFSWNIFW